MPKRKRQETYMLNDPAWDQSMKCFVNESGNPIIYTGMGKQGHFKLHLARTPQ